MDDLEMKPSLNLGHHLAVQRAVAIPNALQGNSIQMSINGIHLLMGDSAMQQNAISLHSNSLPDTSLHNAMAGSALQLMAQPDMALHTSREGPLHSGGGMQGRDSLLQSSTIGKKHDFSPLGNPQQFKRKKEGNGCENEGAPMQRSFRPLLPHRNSSFTPSTSPHLHQGTPNSHQQLHQTLQLPQHCSSTVFQTYLPSPSRMPLEASPNSPIQKPIPSLQGLQLPSQSPQQGNLNGHQSLQTPAPNTLQNLPFLQQSSFQEPSQPPDLAARRLAVQSWGSRPLAIVDPQLWDIMEREKERQWKGVELIASENFTSQAVMEALGSHLTNKYSEGMPGARYYGGNEYIDQIENLCCDRALAAFHLDSESWGVNVQPYSCTSANFAVYTALLQPKDRIMGLDSPSGGHLSHGYYTSSGKKVSSASIYFESFPYKVNPQTGYIDLQKLEEKALDFRPKILICGGSAYPREWNYESFRRIADKCGAILMCDMAHISGIIAAQECASPFDYCDIVTSTTHKSLRGPRGGMIFYRKGPKQRRRISSLYSLEDSGQYDFEERINFAVFPSLQGGPHNNHIAALAVTFKQVASPEYKAYIQQVKKNAQALAAALQRRGCKLVTDGTDNHLILWDLRQHGLTGNRYEKVCELCHVTLNKNAVFGDSGSLAPGGVRIGTPAMTSRGCLESDFEMIAEFLLKSLQITINVQREHGKSQKEFLRGIQNSKDIADLRSSVEKFAACFEMPGL